MREGGERERGEEGEYEEMRENGKRERRKRKWRIGGDKRERAREVKEGVEEEESFRSDKRRTTPRAINDQVNKSETLIADRMAGLRASAVGYHVHLAGAL